MKKLTSGEYDRNKNQHTPILFMNSYTTLNYMLRDRDTYQSKKASLGEILPISCVELIDRTNFGSWMVSIDIWVSRAGKFCV